eukprot:1138969-Pelagomonas_calceolata.AAC.4
MSSLPHLAQGGALLPARLIAYRLLPSSAYATYCANTLGRGSSAYAPYYVRAIHVPVCCNIMAQGGRSHTAPAQAPMCCNILAQGGRSHTAPAQAPTCCSTRGPLGGHPNECCRRAQTCSGSCIIAIQWELHLSNAGEVHGSACVCCLCLKIQLITLSLLGCSGTDVDTLLMRTPHPAVTRLD